VTDDSIGTRLAQSARIEEEKKEKIQDRFHR
jgi:hypothetical protein